MQALFEVSTHLVPLVDAVDELLGWRVPEELDGCGIHSLNLHVLRRSCGHCSQEQRGNKTKTERRGNEGKKRKMNTEPTECHLQVAE